eukprot:3441136-Pleurochrysis_carterae.AAC.1
MSPKALAFAAGSALCGDVIASLDRSAASRVGLLRNGGPCGEEGRSSGSSGAAPAFCFATSEPGWDAPYE